MKCGGNVWGISDHVRKYLFDKFGSKCSDCGWNKVNIHSGKIPLEVDHIDGNFNNCHEDNLKLVCPNCHSLTPTFRALNIGKGNSRLRTMEALRK